MNTNRLENLPTTWDDGRDVPFFRITAGLFSPEFCLGASVLLAGQDDDADDSCSSTAVAQPERELAPVPVRRTR